MEKQNTKMIDVEHPVVNELLQTANVKLRWLSPDGRGGLLIKNSEISIFLKETIFTETAGWLWWKKHKKRYRYLIYHSNPMRPNCPTLMRIGEQFRFYDEKEVISLLTGVCFYIDATKINT